jgi:hypothetical protein
LYTARVTAGDRLHIFQEGHLEQRWKIQVLLDEQPECKLSVIIISGFELCQELIFAGSFATQAELQK